MDRDVANIGNRFVRALPTDVYQQLQASLQPVELRHGTVLGHIGGPVRDLYFPERGLVSLVKVMHDGRTAEVGVIGSEGVVGIIALMGLEEAWALEIMVQLDGFGHRLPVDTLVAKMSGSTKLQALAKRYLGFCLDRMAQATACNVLHRLRQRCCRWLLVAHDNAHSRTFGLTHEFLALMMGVHRPQVSVVLENLQRSHLVETSRGSITILDRAALEAQACECYTTMQQELDRLFVAA